MLAPALQGQTPRFMRVRETSEPIARGVSWFSTSITKECASEGSINNRPDPLIFTIFLSFIHQSIQGTIPRIKLFLYLDLESVVLLIFIHGSPTNPLPRPQTSV